MQFSIPKFIYTLKKSFESFFLLLQISHIDGISGNSPSTVHFEKDLNKGTISFAGQQEVHRQSLEKKKTKKSILLKTKITLKVFLEYCSNLISKL